MSKLPRKSEIKIENEDEMNSLLNDCAEFLKASNLNLSKEDFDYRAYELIGRLHYSIGIIDFNMYQRKDDETLSRQDVQEFLAKRAYYSAMIKGFEGDISLRGYGSKENGIKEYYINDVVDETPIVPKKIYHGTTADVSSEELGNIDRKTGKYHIKDGVTYFTRHSKALKFAHGKEEGIISREIDIEEIGGKNDEGDSVGRAKNGECRKMQITDGYTCFLQQDDLEKYCNSGVKYLFSGTPQVLDISEFSNFVKERDESILNILERYNLQLPQQDQTLDEYLDSIEMSKEKARKGIIWMKPKEQSEEIVPKGYNDLFPTIEKEQEKPHESPILASAIETTQTSSRTGAINEEIGKIKQIHVGKENDEMNK